MYCELCIFWTQNQKISIRYLKLFPGEYFLSTDIDIDLYKSRSLKFSVTHSIMIVN